MLTHIHIRHFAIIDELNLELHPGMTVMTGETGAGKSIMIDALSLCMGDRADTHFIREGSERAEISVTIDISHLPHIQTWLREHELEAGDEVIVRRTLSRDGRSRAYVNGEVIPVTQLKKIAEDFIEIHSQHAHHALLKPDTHKHLLDMYGKQVELAQSVRTCGQALKNCREDIALLQSAESQKHQEMEFVRFQLDELLQVNPKTDEWATLNQQYDKLSHASTLMNDIAQVLNILSEDDAHALITQLSHVKHQLDNLTSHDADLKSIASLIDEAKINCAEAASMLSDYLSDIDNDPNALETLNERLGLLHQLARKHRTEPEALPALMESFQSKLDGLNGQEIELGNLISREKQLSSEYDRLCAELIEKRKIAGKQLSSTISDAMKTLGMPEGEFQVALDGLDVVFNVKMNAGQKFQPLHKTASGGELSRISLALQVSIVQDESLPVIVFDEVDVGIGGGTAEIVGQLLHTLGKKAQVLCVTHLPQVAAQGDQHFYICKESDGTHTRTVVKSLSKTERIEEIARMLGGIKITENTKKHASEMLGL